MWRGLLAGMVLSVSAVSGEAAPLVWVEIVGGLSIPCNGVAVTSPAVPVPANAVARRMLLVLDTTGMVADVWGTVEGSTPWQSLGQGHLLNPTPGQWVRQQFETGWAPDGIPLHGAVSLGAICEGGGRMNVYAGLYYSLGF